MANGHFEEYIKTLVEDHEENSYPLGDVDRFSTFAYLTFDEQARYSKRLAAEIVLGKHAKDGEEPPVKRIWLWVGAHAVEAALGNLFEEYEGMPASSDKARFVLEAYDKRLAGAEIPALPAEGERNGFVPSRGTVEQWLDVAELIFKQRYGKAYVELLGEIYG